MPLSLIKKKLQYFAFHEKDNPLTLSFRNVQMGFDKSLTLYKINGKIKFQQTKNFQWDLTFPSCRFPTLISFDGKCRFRLRNIGNRIG